MDQPGPSGLQGNPRGLSLNAQEKRAKRARLSAEARAAENAEDARRKQMRRREMTIETRENLNEVRRDVYAAVPVDVREDMNVERRNAYAAVPVDARERVNEALRDVYAAVPIDVREDINVERRNAYAAVPVDARERVNEALRDAYAAVPIDVREDINAERRVRDARRRPRRTHVGAAVLDTPNTFPCVPHDLGPMNRECDIPHCRAVHFAGEKARLLHSCCHQGKVYLPELRLYPETLRVLLAGDDASTRHFREFIRQYNSAHAFASFGAKNVVPPGNGPYCFKIQGAVHHNATTALRAENGFAAHPQPLQVPGQVVNPVYGQVYVFDPDEAAELRMRHPANQHLHLEVMLSIAHVMRDVSPYAAWYKSLGDAVREEEARVQRVGGEMRQLSLIFRIWGNDDRRRYNMPTTMSEIAILYEAGRDGAAPQNIDIAVHPRAEHGCRRVSGLSPHIDPMVFPMLFPAGDFGWTPGLPCHPDYHRGRRDPEKQTITALQFYAHRIAVRRHAFSALHLGGKLFQQFLVHAYLRVESGRLDFIANNQTALRVETYQGLQDHVRNMAADANARVGNIVILPATFTGSPRHMQQLYQDAMAIVRKYGKPDIFATFTCNPNWPEITRELLPGQTPSDRPDLVARVFELKNAEFLEDLTKRHVLGVCVAYIMVIEEQKRCLPHSHTLITLREEDKPRTGEHIDRFASAEMPAPDDPVFWIIMRNNIHGPCGVLNPNCVCMENGKCKKNFPKEFRDETEGNVNGHCLYKRRDNTGANHTTPKGQPIDNRWVVPYNRYLSLKYNAHINVEVVSSTERSVKYLHKYITKGHDCARIEVRRKDAGGNGDRVVNHDEIAQFRECRYVGAPEAAWRLSENPIYAKSHTVMKLAVHVEGGQQVYFNENEEERALRIASVRDTTLTAWFKLNIACPAARALLYQDIPYHYVFSGKQWLPRQRGEDRVISRIVSVSPRNVDLWHLRLLLLHVPGATSFADLRTVNGLVMGSYRDAARELGLFQDDGEWDRCMVEAATWMMPKKLRDLFVMILVHCQPGDPMTLWGAFAGNMSEDFVHAGEDGDTARALALTEIECALQREGSSCAEKGLPIPPPPNAILRANDAKRRHHEAEGARMFALLHDDQRAIVTEVFNALSHDGDDVQRCFFVDGQGGAGKTYVYETMVHVKRGEGENVLCVAWTGIAAILLPDGMTCHTAFNLPLNITATTCPKLTLKAKARLRAARLIIWDEARMSLGDALVAVDRVLRDLMGTDRPFGGKVMVLGGDFRQCLPVIRHATPAQVIAKSLKRCPLWSQFRVMRLTTNRRAGAALDFAAWLLALGNGTLARATGKLSLQSIRVPRDFLSGDLVHDLFGQTHRIADAAMMSKRAILCPKNEHARLINDEVLARLEGLVRTYRSIDRVKAEPGDDEDALQVQYPPEFLHSLNPSGLPPHELNLKIGAVVMVLRNLCIENGICNGTRMIVRDMKDNVILGEVINGVHAGQVHMIPRVSLDTSSDPRVPFTHVRHQLPIRVAYVMTINKSQGQTLDRVGLLLPEPVFSHGQLYVACSRVRNGESLKIQVIDGEKQGLSNGDTITDNVVYPEVL